MGVGVVVYKGVFRKFLKNVFQKKEMVDMKRNVRFIALAVCLVMLVFSGCDAALKTAQNKMVEVTINTTLNFAMDETIRANVDSAYVDGVTEVAQHIRNKVTLKVTDSTISGDGMTAQCVILAPNMVDFIENFDLSNYENEQEVYDAVIAAADNAPVSETEVTIGLTKNENGEFDAIDVESLIAAYLGTEDMDMVYELLSMLQ